MEEEEEEEEERLRKRGRGEEKLCCVLCVVPAGLHDRQHRTVFTAGGGSQRSA